MKFYVYAYYDPTDTGSMWGFNFPIEGPDSTGCPFYVGKGSAYRAWEHLSEAKNQRSLGKLLYNKIRKLLSKGVEPVIDMIWEGMEEVEAYDLENFLIQRWGRRDQNKGPLCNHTDGGDGACPKYQHTQSRIEKIRQATIERWKDPTLREKMVRRYRPTRAPLFRIQRQPSKPRGLKPEEVASPDNWDREVELIRLDMMLLDLCQAMYHNHCHAIRHHELDVQRLKTVKLQEELIQQQQKAQRQKRKASINWCKTKKTWRVQFNGSSMGSRALYCDAISLKLAREEAHLKGETWVPRKRGDHIRRKTEAVA